MFCCKKKLISAVKNRELSKIQSKKMDIFEVDEKGVNTPHYACENHDVSLIIVKIIIIKI